MPNGGEVIADNPYNDFDNAVRDLSAMHITYLNQDYDKAVFDKWAAAEVSGQGCFDGLDGLSYIRRRLGYRLLITQTTAVRRLLQQRLDLTVSFRNAGFAPLYAAPELTLTVQKEVADLLSAAAGAPEYGAVTAALGLDYRVRTTRTISRKLFTPEPNVDSAVVRLDHAPQCENAAAVRKLIRSAFSMRRKTLVNNLSGAGYKKPYIVAALEKLSFPADVRGERLSPTDYIRLYHLLTNTPAPV